MGRMRAYADVLNALSRQNALDLEEAERFWVERVKAYFDSQPFTFKLDPSKSLRFCVRHLLAQGVARQRETKGTMYAGAIMQHLVGAKLNLITDGKVDHHGFSVADAPSWFALNGIAVPSTSRGSRFDRSFLAIAAAADGLGVALESTLLAEREILRGRLVAPLAG